MTYKMKGFSGFKSSPAKKALVGAQDNLPEGLKSKIEAAPGKMYDSPAKQKVSGDKSQTRTLYKGPLSEEDTKKLKKGESHNEIFNEKDEAAWFEEQDGNELSGDEKKKSRKKSDAMFNEAYIVRDRGVGKKKKKKK